MKKRAGAHSNTFVSHTHTHTHSNTHTHIHRHLYSKILFMIPDCLGYVKEPPKKNIYPSRKLNEKKIFVPQNISHKIVKNIKMLDKINKNPFTMY